MNSPILQLLILAGIAVFLVLRLRSVLGTRDGFENKPKVTPRDTSDSPKRAFEVIEGGPDLDITDHVPEDGDAARALAAMKRADPSFGVSDFLDGARGAYEMILMGFERGDLDDIQPYLAEEVFDTFVEVVSQREDQGLTIEADFVGVREMTLNDATFDEETSRAEITVRYVGELTSVVKNAEGEIVEGSPTAVKRQKDLWTYARDMSDEDPNWQLVATDA